MKSVFVALISLTLGVVAAQAQTAATPLYRVFLADGSALASYGEWARVADRLVFSMPLTADAEPSQLHLVSIAADRVDWRRTDQYADAVRADHYARTHGEEDFARLSADVARVLNEVALVGDPTERLIRAQYARRSLADWPTAHYGYRSQEVHEILGVLDEVIGGLRASAGLGQYELALMATTAPAPAEPLLPAPDQRQIVEQLVVASTLAETPAERMSLLRTVVGIVDRAVDLLPKAWAARVRATALGAMAVEQRTDAAYARLRTAALAQAAHYAQLADVRKLERLRTRIQEQDQNLGKRRVAEVTALLAAVDTHLSAAHRLRLARDQWQLRVDKVRAYQRASSTAVEMLTRAQRSLDDIRSLAGPTPQRLRPLVQQLAREGRHLAIIDAPGDLAPIHAVFRSACELALNAAQMRLDAAQSGDLGLAQQASSAAAGALMLLSRAKGDLDAALKPPTAPVTFAQP